MSLGEQLTLEVLNKCKIYKNSIDILTRNIELIEEEIYNLKPLNLDSIKVKGASNYRLEEKLQEKKDYQVLLNANIKRITNLESSIRQLRDPETVNIFLTMYIKGISNINDLEKELKMSRSTIYRKRDKGIKDLSQIMWGEI